MVVALLPSRRAQRINFSPGMRLKYHDGAAWITGVLRSTEPANLALDDQTEIHTARQILADGVRDGLIEVEWSSVSLANKSPGIAPPRR